MPHLRSLFICLAVMAACSGKGKDNADLLKQGDPNCQPPPVEIFLQAAEQLNPTSTGQSMPVEVRVLLLRDRTRFDQLDFETVWQASAEVLAKDLVDSSSVMVFPSKLQIHPVKSSGEVQFIALVALFRQPKARSWQHVVDLREANRRCADEEALHTVIHAQLSGTKISKPDAPPPASDK